MNIIFGGSFNPPTKAHEEIITHLINKYKPSEFIVLPVGDNYPHKSNLVSFYHRYNMLRLVDINKDFSISLKEYEEHSFIGTYNLLKKFNLSNIYYVIGADNLTNIKGWLNSDKLLKEYKFIVINRKEDNLIDIINNEFKEYKDSFIFENLHNNCSSTLVREDIKKYQYMISSKVYKYIKIHNLYE